MQYLNNLHLPDSVFFKALSYVILAEFLKKILISLIKYNHLFSEEKMGTPNLRDPSPAEE